MLKFFKRILIFFFFFFFFLTWVNYILNSIGLKIINKTLKSDF